MKKSKSFLVPSKKICRFGAKLKQMQELSYDTFKKLQKESDFELIDIREKYENDCINIGGLNIPMGELEDNLNIFDSDKSFVFLCQTGKRAKAVANYLKTEHKILNCYYIDGGIEKLAEFEELDLDRC